MGLSSLMLLTACGGGNKDKTAGTQVAVRVNDQEVSVHQAGVLMQRVSAQMPGQPASAVAQRVVADLVDQELAAQAAKAAKLQDDPRVIQELEAARREVLAGAWQRQQTDSISEPSADEVDAYFDKNPALFAQRKLYQLRETTLRVADDQLEAARSKLQATTSPGQVADYVRERSFSQTTRQFTMAAEDLPFAVLQPLSGLTVGRSLVLPREGGLRVLTVIDAQLAPMERQQARRYIAAFLTNERRQALLTERMKTLRDQARIEYVGPYAAYAPTAKPAASTPRP